MGVRFPAKLAKVTGAGDERIREEDFAEMERALEGQDDARERFERAKIAVEEAAATFNELNRRLIKRYKLADGSSGTTDLITRTGLVRRNVPLTDVQGRRA